MFDTHKCIKILKQEGLKEKQAESIVRIVSESREMDMSKVATKEQVEMVKMQVQTLEKRLDKFEITTNARFDRLEQTHRWIIGLMLTMMGMMMGIFGLVIKLAFFQ